MRYLRAGNYCVEAKETVLCRNNGIKLDSDQSHSEANITNCEGGDDCEIDDGSPGASEGWSYE